MTLHRNFSQVLRALFVVAAIGCGTSPDETPTDSESLLERCEGAFACTIYVEGQPSGTLKGDLVRREEACWWRDDEGTPRLNISVPGITFRDDSFLLGNSADDYIECLPLSTTSSAGSRGRCTGTARSCASMGLYCTSQDGCSWDIGNASTGSDDRCTGSADSCSSFSEDNCEYQDGCTWTA